jgi:hypothetical protein
MEDKLNQSIQTGAMTLTLLVEDYKSQVIALLLKNGVAVPNGASNEEITKMVANLLRISKSFANDLNFFIQNPKVLKTLSDGFAKNAQYFRASGSDFVGKKSGNAQYFRASGYMNSTGGEDGFTDTKEPTPTATAPKTGFWSGLNLGELINQGVGTFVTIDKNKTDRAIANARAQVGLASGAGAGAGAGANVDEEEDEDKDKDKDKGANTTKVVVLSLVGVAVIGAIVYFIAKYKKSEV